MNLLKSVIKYVFVFVIMGTVYYLLESIFKGYWTDYRMFLLAGFIGVVIGLINNVFTFDTSFILQCVVGMLIALLCECIFGYQWNIVEGLGLWDYSNLPLSAVGNQINAIFAVVWLFISALAIVIDDWIRYRFFHEERPRYRL